MAAGEGGGSQPQLFSGDDGCYYMVKTRNNPQGARVVVNEILGGLCLQWLQVKHPPTAVIDLPLDVITDSPGARFSDGSEISPGAAFGSEYWQSDPDGSVAPASIINLTDVGGTIVYDTWVKQFDGRQSRVRAAPHDPGKYEFFPVDQGHSFGGPEWSVESLGADLKDVSLRASTIAVTRLDLTTAIQQLGEFNGEIADAIVSPVPRDWMSDAERLAVKDYLLTRAMATVAVLETAYP